MTLRDALIKELEEIGGNNNYTAEQIADRIGVVIAGEMASGGADEAPDGDFVDYTERDFGQHAHALKLAIKAAHETEHPNTTTNRADAFLDWMRGELGDGPSTG